MPIAKTLTKPRPSPIVTAMEEEEVGAMLGRKDFKAKRGRELGEPSDPIETEPTEAATPVAGKEGGGEEWVDSTVSSEMEEMFRKCPFDQPEQLTPVAAPQPRPDVCTAGRKSANSPAKLRRVRRRRRRSCRGKRRTRKGGRGGGRGHAA